jgi:5-methylcytosine-specific restriction endonuclease McrA
MARTRNANAGKKRKRKEKLYILQNGACHYCQYQFPKARLTFDHVIRWKDGGTNHISNLVLACEPCNAMRELQEDAGPRVRQFWIDRHRSYVQKHAL